MIIIKIQGGLGNQLFQYATARHLSLINNTNMYWDLSFYANEKFKGIFRLDQYNIKVEAAAQKDIEKLKSLTNPSFIYRSLSRVGIRNEYFKKTHWNENDLANHLTRKIQIKESIYLEGWFARERFFSEHREHLLKELVLNEISKETFKWKSEIDASNSIAIHVRRGDYMKNPYFYNLETQYYQKAIRFFKEKFSDSQFYFFSDDLQWVRNEFGGKKEYKFVDINNEKIGYFNTIKDTEDLFLISQCKHQIIANSTYSWWGAWLNTNPDKIVITPTKWSNDNEAQKKYEKGDFIPEKWIKIPD
jgi:hypothetical protein